MPAKRTTSKRQTERGLTKMQRAFVVAYVETGVGAEAVRLAGYKVKKPAVHANALLNNDRVRSAIDGLLQAAASAASVTPELIMKGLLAEATDPKNKGGERVAAWRALQQMVPGALVPKRLVHSGSVSVPVVVVPDNKRAIEYEVPKDGEPAESQVH